MNSSALTRGAAASVRALFAAGCLALVVGAGLIASPGVAHAELDPDQIESPKIFNASLSFGGFWLADENIRTTYGSDGKFQTKLTFGVVPWSKYIHVEVNLAVSFLQFSGSQRFVNGGATSADKVMFTLFPLNLDLAIGIDLVHEQPVVPYGGVGFAWTPWRENEHGGGQKWVGYRFGGNAFFGGAFLLDVIERRRSRELDAKSGINDAYLTVEGRYHNVNATLRDGAISTEGLTMGGWSVHGGLKLVF